MTSGGLLCAGGFFRRGISGGERKRVSVGHEMIINPSVLLLDEPTSGVSSAFTVLDMGLCTFFYAEAYLWYMVLHVLMPCLFAAALTVERKPVNHDHACLATGCNEESHMRKCNKLYRCMYAYMTVFYTACVLPSGLIPQSLCMHLAEIGHNMQMCVSSLAAVLAS